MGTKRKQESSLKSEPSQKIRRIVTAASDQERDQDSPTAYSSSTRERPAVPSPASTPAPLTKKNLRCLESMTGSKGLKSVATTTSSLHSRTGTQASSGSKISATNAGFKERFRDNHALDYIESGTHPYANEAEITDRLFRNRGSATPPPSEYHTIGKMISDASNEREVEAIVTNYILKPAMLEPALVGMDYKAKFDKQWTAFPEDVGFNNGLAAPKPDLTEGFMRKTFPPTISSLGSCATLVKDDANYVALPHFVAEFKDVGKDMDQAGVQAGYDGAAMVYARNQALAYLGQPDPPRTASVASVISNGLDWKVFVHYAHRNAQNKNIEWYQVRVAAGDIATYKDFKTARTVLRNTQDWAREQSADLRDRLQKDYEPNVGDDSPPPSGSSRAPPTSECGDGQRVIPHGTKPGPRSGSSVLSGESRSHTPGPASSTSAASGKWHQDRRPGDANRLLPDDRDRHRPRRPNEGELVLRGRDRDDQSCRDYRERRSGEGSIEPVQRRRSDNPQDRDRSRDRKDDRRGSVGGSSTAGSSRASGKVVVPPPPRPKGGIFSSIKKPKGHE